MKTIQYLLFSMFFTIFCGCTKDHLLISNENEPDNPYQIYSTERVIAYSPFLTPSECINRFGLCSITQDGQGAKNYYSFYIFCPEEINKQLILPISLKEVIPHKEGELWIDTDYPLPPEISGIFGYIDVILKIGIYPVDYSINPFGDIKVHITGIDTTSK